MCISVSPASAEFSSEVLHGRDRPFIEVGRSGKYIPCLGQRHREPTVSVCMCQGREPSGGAWKLTGQAPCSEGNRSRWMRGFQPCVQAPVCMAGLDGQHRQRRLGAAREYYREGRSIRLPASSRTCVNLASRGSRLLTGLGGAQFPCRFGDSRDLPRASMDSLAHEPDPSSQHPEPLGRQQC